MFRMLFAIFTEFFQFEFILVFSLGIGFVFGGDVVTAVALGAD